MTVVFDAYSTGFGSTTDVTVSHTPVGAPRAVIAFVTTVQATDIVSGCTYDGEAMTEVALSPILKSSGEAGGVHCFFLGSGVNTGTVDCVAEGTSAQLKDLDVITLTAAGDVEVIDTSTISSDSVSNPSVTVSLGGRTCFVVIAFRSGQDAVSGISANSGWTERKELDGGSRVHGNYTYDTIGSTDVSAGWQQTADDAVALAIGVSEVVVAGSIINPIQGANLGADLYNGTLL